MNMSNTSPQPDDKELREKLKDIVTRGGMSARIPEVLEEELDKLVSFIHERDKHRDAVVAKKARNDTAGDIYAEAMDIVLHRPASAIVVGGTDLDKLLTSLERQYGKDLIQHVYGKRNKLEQSNQQQKGES